MGGINWEDFRVDEKTRIVATAKKLNDWKIIQENRH